MGINVSIYKFAANGSRIEHPDWDWVRHVGDRELPGALSKIGEETIERDEVDYYRPKDPTELCVYMCTHYQGNEARWRQLAEILSDGQWWLRFSY